jgi:hypothetical protein
VLTSVLKNQVPQIAKYLSQISYLVIIGGCLAAVKPLIAFIRDIVRVTSLSSSVLNTVITAAAISFICGTVYDLCKENGEIALSNAVLFVGNIQISLMIIPILKELIYRISQVLSV